MSISVSVLAVFAPQASKGFHFQYKDHREKWQPFEQGLQEELK